jgi:hypothetical protein
MPRVRSKERVAALREVARSGMGMGRVLISVVSRQSSGVRGQKPHPLANCARRMGQPVTGLGLDSVLGLRRLLRASARLR